jgi:uncharacterized protein (TIGR03083 family)
MPTSLTVEEHIEALRVAADAMLGAATQAGLDAPVPTCPTWDVRALLAHQAMVHRWAAAQVNGTDPDAVPNQTTLRETVPDLLGYFAEGAHALLEALRTAPDDLAAMTFLNDAPPPRHFWARRQAHETTVHAADASSALTGSTDGPFGPIDTRLAVDGIDELLRGFFTRGKCKLFDGTDYTVRVTPDDADAAWLVRIGPTLTVAEPSPSTDDAAVEITGPAEAIYLGLWNRGPLTVTGDASFVERWRTQQRVRWS